MSSDATESQGRSSDSSPDSRTYTYSSVFVIIELYGYIPQISVAIEVGNHHDIHF